MLSVRCFLQFVVHVLSIFNTAHVLTLNLEYNLPAKLFSNKCSNFDCVIIYNYVRFSQ